MQGVVAFFSGKKLADDALWGDRCYYKKRMTNGTNFDYAVRVPLQENLASNVAGIILHERTEPSNLVRFPYSLWKWLGGSMSV